MQHPFIGLIMRLYKYNRTEKMAIVTFSYIHVTIEIQQACILSFCNHKEE